MRDDWTIRAGGIALVAGAVAFVGVFAFLAARFDYPAVLDGSASDVLPELLNTGPSGRAAWALYGFLPLVWIPAGVGAFQALRPNREGSMRMAMLFAWLATMSMMLGLLRWPSVHWALAEVYATVEAPDRALIGALFTGLNSYLGNYIGEFLGELSVSLFFLLSSLAMLTPGGRFPRWMGYVGVVTAIAGLIGMFRNVTSVVDPVAAVNNYLLPVWMVAFGVGLLRYDRAGPVTSSYTRSRRSFAGEDEPI
jgi:uncharacterized protein DUF4386